MNLVEPVLETISYLLDLHYQVVTSVGASTYETIATLVATFHAITCGIRLVLGEIVTFTLDTCYAILHLSKVIIWIIAWLAVIAQHSLLAVESLLYNVCLGVLSVTGWFWSMLTDALTLLQWVISLPYVHLICVDNHLRWCYSEIGRLLSDLTAAAVHALTRCFCHVLFIPHHLASGVWRTCSGLFHLIIRLIGAVQTLSSNSYQHLKHLSRNTTVTLSATLGAVKDTYSSSGQWIFYDSSLFCSRSFVFITQTIDEVYFADVHLVFSEQATIGMLLYSTFRLPFKVVVTFMKDIFTYLEQVTSLGESQPTPINSPLPNISRNFYCTLEELLWLAWLTLRTNWQGIVLFSILIGGLHLIMTYQNFAIRRFHLPIAGERDQPEAAPAELELEDEMGPEVSLPQVRHRRVTRSRSKTPDLTTPGAETRYIHKLKRRLDSEVDNRRCVVCHHLNRSILLMPCKHVCLCSDCAQEVLRRRPASCPLCRSRILQVVDVFL